MPTFEGVDIATTADIDFEVVCATCGAGLCNNSSVDNRSSYNKVNTVSVEACEACMLTAKEKGDEEGYDRGFNDGVAHAD